MGYAALIVLVLVLGGVAAYYAWLAQKERREALLALATELGFSFDPAKDRSHDDRYAHFEIFRRGHSRAAYNTMQGTLANGWPAQMGDFIYKITRRSGKSSHTRTYRFSYLIVHLPWTVPDLLIRPEGMFDKLAGAFGFEDIDFESAEFSRRFHVKSPDKRFAYDVIDPRMMEFLLAGSPTIDIEHGRCCISDGKSRWEPAGFESRLAWIVDFFGHWPTHVVTGLEGG